MDKKKRKEIFLYLVFGGLTTVIGIGSFYIFNEKFLWNEHLSNVISWICAVTFAYITNRYFVFDTITHGRRGIIRECTGFFFSRLATLGIEEVMILIFVTLLCFNGTIVKTIAQVMVIVLNYIFSKLFVFR